jgi:two-component sensor histidine kinase/ligand-binding sensor domain-containing protein
VINLIKGSDGALWIVTLAGVTRFDGVNFFDYDPQKLQDGYIVSSNIFKIIEDSNGLIFAASRDAGLLQFDPHSNSFFSPTWPSQNSQLTSKISAALTDDSGNIWLGYEAGFSARLNSQKQQTKIFHSNNSDAIIDFTQSASGEIYAATTTGNIFVAKRGSESAHFFNLPNLCKSEIFSLSAISSINHNEILVGTKGSGIYILNTLEEKCRPLFSQHKKSYDLDHANIRQIYYDVGRKIGWVASDQGVYQLDQAFNVTHFNSSNSNLSDNEVGSIAQGVDGVIWIGTYSGLDYSVPTIFDIYDNRELESLHSVVAIDGSKEDGIWIATYGGLLYYDSVSERHYERKDTHPERNFTDEKIMSILTTPNGMWVGYRSSGLEYFSFSENSIASFGLDSLRKISSNSISAILTASSGETLIGTYGGGLNIISASGSIDSYSIGDDRVIMLHQTRDNTIWIGTESKLLELHLPTRSFNELDFESSITSSKVKPVVWSMAEDSTGGLWLGTMHHGLFFWPKHGQTRRNLALAQRLVDYPDVAMSIYAIEIDDFDNVWYSTNRGLEKLDPLEKETQIFSRQHGLTNTEFDFGVSYKDSHGRLYFGGSNGYIRFDPKEVNFKLEPPRLKIVGIDFPDRSLMTHSNLEDPTTLNLTHKDYFVKFDFSVLDFLDPEKNQYRYKLDGFDPDWIENGTTNSATYTNLPAGDYVLRVQGANSAGVWNREGASLNIIVAPAPWFSWWAFCIYGMIGSFLFWMAKRSYDSYAIERRATQMAAAMHEAAERADDEMQEQLEIQDDLVKSVYQHNVSTLNMISGFISQQSHYLHDSLAREATQTSINRVNALAVLEGCLYYQSDKVMADLGKYTDIIISTLLKDSPVSAERITTINEISNQPLPIEVASPLAIAVYELLENCIQHAFEQESPANFIHITFEDISDPPDSQLSQHRLTVADNGLGMPSNIDLHMLETSGLAIVSSIATRLSGTLEFDDAQGTTVRLTFPTGASQC